MEKRALVGLWGFTASGLLLFTFFLSSCGEERSICRKAFDVRYENLTTQCKQEVVGRDGCWQCLCLCYMDGRTYSIVMDAQGLPDFEYSSCDPEDPCDEEGKYLAEGCLADEDACKSTPSPYDDLTFAGIHFCDPLLAERPGAGECNWK